ncbi:MAG: hypothetical protein R2911_45565 [Caldilineaceae bacterium]
MQPLPRWTRRRLPFRAHADQTSVRQAVKAMIEAGEHAAAYRLRQRQPALSMAEALRSARLRA